MKSILPLFLSVFAVASCVFGDQQHLEQAKPSGGCTIVNIVTKEGTSSQAAYFQGELDKVVVFVPGAVFDKESWYFLAEEFQKCHLASLCMDGKSEQSVLSAIDLLKQKGFKQIVLVGGSMGGAAVLDALAEKSDGHVSKIVLLAPAGGVPVESSKIDKLFIVAENDRLGLFGTVKKLYNDSAEPKKLEVVDGVEHAQHLFKTDQREVLIKLIVDFVVQNQRINP